MKTYKLVFSPTGGTKKVADVLAEAFGAECATIDLSEPGFSGCDLEEDALAVIAMPSFGGRAPHTAIERLEKVRGNGARAVVVAVYGNRAQEDTLLEMADTAKGCGFQVVAGVSAVAEHSIAHQYAKGRPDGADIGQLQAFAKQIADRLKTGGEAKIPGNRPYKKAGAGLVPSTTSACVGCGLCAARCPVGAIEKENPKHTNKDLCINCMRCVSLCPQKARRVNALMVKTVGAALKKACSDRKENELFLS